MSTRTVFLSDDIQIVANDDTTAVSGNDIQVSAKEVKPDNPSNLLSAIKAVLEYVGESGLGDDYYDQARVPLDYLCERLHLTPVQVTLLGVVMELGFEGSVSMSRIAHYLEVKMLDMVTLGNDIDVLLDRRLIVKKKSRGEVEYTVPQVVYDAFRHNTTYRHDVPILQTDEELANLLDKYLCELDDDDSEDAVLFFDQDIQDLLLANKHIGLAKTLLNVMKQSSKEEFRVALLMSMMWIRDEEVDVESFRFSIVIKNRFRVRQMTSLLQQGRSILNKKNIVVAADNNGFTMRDSFSLSPQFRKSLTPDRDTDTSDDGKEKRHLTHCADIQSKELFYNPDAVNEVDRLKRLLQPDQMKFILERLKNSGLRGGFTGLLYGGPGTGKTETVLQLARLSGRDIFQVDVSQMRSKWYGESERLVKSMFDDYRDMVRKSPTAPILFFNEADAIFTRRMKNAQRSVDKGENALQNIILQEMETLDGILIATTNLQDNLDPAFERRFLYKLHLDKPTVPVKAKIWKSMLPGLSEQDSLTLARQFDFSGGQIENIVRKRFIDEVLYGGELGFEEILTLCRNEQLSDNHKQQLGFMRHSS